MYINVLGAFLNSIMFLLLLMLLGILFHRDGPITLKDLATKVFLLVNSITSVLYSPLILDPDASLVNTLIG